MAPLEPDPYEALGLSRNATQLDIKKQYRAQKQDEFHGLVKAYKTLGNEDERVRYDAEVKPAELREETKRRIKEYNRRRFGMRIVDTARQDDERRKEFLAFALKLYDERAELFKHAPRDQEPASVSAQQQTENDKETPGSIEKRIKERNHVYEKLRGVERSRSPHSTPEPQVKSTKKEILYIVPVGQLNLEIMNPERTDVCVDIMAVHGLGAIPDITWRERRSGINWLSFETMLPSATPRARILRFGYDSLWMGKTPIRTSLSTIAYKLLLSLGITRMEDLQRSLIFIGHCFGGLVIQRALNLARMQHNAYPGVFGSSVGIVSLGTPHRGTQLFTQTSALFAAIAASSDLSQKLDIAVLNSLASEEGGILDVTHDFVSLCTDCGPMITCFFEQHSFKLGKVFGRDDIEEFVVDQKSATLDGHRKYRLELDHFSLNKFDGPDNPNYVQDDSSALIIKRWVPDYERDFLWDHSQAVRDDRDRKPNRKHYQEAKARTDEHETKTQSSKKEKDWFARMLDTFNDVSSRKEHGTSNVDDLEKLMKKPDRERPRYNYDSGLSASGDKDPILLKSPN
ncbi:hypothetical protein EK21DRAFT_111960 [Setomelanomma holmii]|uniref:J domain-containing protein n=1 Tax=Setomelanomma holmii TaxID=210430 RepID=A0A9P4LKJ0_9PLEO|nr:hypothetical protein EK21DRAFT_111960 [Setomelanomma holmii]